MLAIILQWKLYPFNYLSICWFPLHAWKNDFLQNIQNSINPWAHSFDVINRCGVVCFIFYFLVANRLAVMHLSKCSTSRLVTGQFGCQIFHTHSCHCQKALTMTCAPIYTICNVRKYCIKMFLSEFLGGQSDPYQSSLIFPLELHIGMVIIHLLMQSLQCGAQGYQGILTEVWLTIPGILIGIGWVQILTLIIVEIHVLERSFWQYHELPPLSVTLETFCPGPTQYLAVVANHVINTDYHYVAIIATYCNLSSSIFYILQIFSIFKSG